MIRFFLKLLALSLIVISLFLIILLAIPSDKNSYLQAYNNKIKLIEKTPSPRVLFMGASTLAYNIDSKKISDSLKVNAINLGLSAGIGAKYYLEDYIDYIKKGDVVVMMPSYIADFEMGGNGSEETLTELMIVTDWHNIGNMNYNQLYSVCAGIPYFCYRNIIRLIKSPLNGFDTITDQDVFKFAANGFNKYGDEESHLHYENNIIENKSIIEPGKIVPEPEFVSYLKDIISRYEESGATVVLMPEISSKNNYIAHDPKLVVDELNKNGLDYAVNPKDMVFPNSYGFGEYGGAHFAKEGVSKASDRIIQILKYYVL